MINRVEITDKAADIVARLREQHRALMFHQSGGCCGFSVEAPEGVRFLTRSRVFTDAEVTALEAAGPPSRAA